MKTYGLDIGTMNLVSAKLEDSNDKLEGSDSKKNVYMSSLRNVFLEANLDDMGTLDLSNISFTKIDDLTYILAEDAYNFANIFARPLSRPMSKGLISPDEVDSIDILAAMIKELIGTAKDGICCYSIPANPIDSKSNTIYHQNVFNRILSELGYDPKPILEGVAIIYAECASTDFSGMGISFGAGMTNIAVVYKSIPIITFSISRGGDWIDENTANSTNTIDNRVTLIKESSVKNSSKSIVKKKKEKQIRDALDYYYENLINYTITNIISRLNKLTADLPNELPVIISGGTSLAENFLDLTKKTIENSELPFDISVIRHATNPLTCVAEGCLVKALRL